VYLFQFNYVTKLCLIMSKLDILFVSHLTDILHLLIYFGYPLSFVLSMDTLDLLN
jgi:hypothetical protein